MLLILNVLYVLVAIAMIALILMQRGAGAQAGSGFGAGASATVFGSRGASNFLSKSTKWLSIVFFSVALFMAWNATHSAKPKAASEQDLGVMSQTAVPKADQKGPAGQPAPKAVPQTIPAAPTQSVPAAPTPSQPAPAATPPASPAPKGG
ncbi:MAG: preprotein translocase subunit SecG [Xanthomonadales bacterium]|nr:preprotein translocase subunit SecG [Xanthomonadales bacterium]